MTGLNRLVKQVAFVALMDSQNIRLKQNEQSHHILVTPGFLERRTSCCQSATITCRGAPPPPPLSRPQQLNASAASSDCSVGCGPSAREAPPLTCSGQRQQDSHCRSVEAFIAFTGAAAQGGVEVIAPTNPVRC